MPRRPILPGRRPSALLLLLSIVLLGACSSSRLRVVRVDYRPSPAVLRPARADEETPALRLLASVVGAVPRSLEGGLRHELHVRLYLENLGLVPVQLHARRMVLLAADLQPFDTPRMVSAQPGPDGRRHVADATTSGVSVEPGTVETADVYFPLPEGRRPGSMRLDGLSLRIGVLVDGGPVVMTGLFQRVGTDPYPFDDPKVRVQIGTYDPWTPVPYRVR